MKASLTCVFPLDSHEPLFVKNLENVQGDERDVILLSMAYGPDQSGKFYKRFGPLNRQGGERRLNVAITRAREKIIFVSSVRSRDLELASSTAAGPQLLKWYLEYAERGMDALGTERIASIDVDFDSPFEAEVAAELERRASTPAEWGDERVRGRERSARW